MLVGSFVKLSLIKVVEIKVPGSMYLESFHSVGDKILKKKSKFMVPIAPLERCST